MKYRRPRPILTALSSRNPYFWKISNVVAKLKRCLPEFEGFGATNNHFCPYCLVWGYRITTYRKNAAFSEADRDSEPRSKLRNSPFGPLMDLAILQKILFRRDAGCFTKILFWLASKWNPDCVWQSSNDYILDFFSTKSADVNPQRTVNTHKARLSSEVRLCRFWNQAFICLNSIFLLK